MADTRTGAAAPILPAALAASPQTPTTTAPEPRALLQELSGLMQESGFGPDHPWCMAVAASLAAHPAAPGSAAAGKPAPAETAPHRWPRLVSTAPLFSIGDTLYAIQPGAALPDLLLDLQHLLSACEGVMASIADEMTAPLSGGPSKPATLAYWGGLLLLRQCTGIVDLVQGMTEFPDKPAWNALAVGRHMEGGAA